MKLRVLVLGQDLYWLTAVQNATANLMGLASTQRFAGDPLQSISQLPRAKASTILLVDASGDMDVEDVVKRFISRGWRYVIAVAADITAKQATSVLHMDQGYDYWEKTYDETQIAKKVSDCIDEINGARQLKKLSRTAKAE